MIYKNLWDATKVEHRGKFIILMLVFGKKKGCILRS